MEISFTPNEIESIKSYTARKIAESNQFGMKHRNEFDAGKRDMNLMQRRGYAGEFALAKLLGIEIVWKPYKKGAPDLLDFIHVRTTGNPNGGLWNSIGNDDEHNPYHVWVLMVAQYPKIRFAGWCYESEIRTPQCKTERYGKSIYIRKQRDLRTWAEFIMHWDANDFARVPIIS